MSNVELFKRIKESCEGCSKYSIDFTKQNIENYLKGNYKKNLYMKGEIISREGDDDRCLYFIERGKVILLRKDTYGKEYSNGYLMPGEFFGFSSLIDMKDEVSVAALTNCHIYVIDVNEVKNIMDNNPAFKDYINKTLINQLRLLIIRQGNLIMSGCRLTFANFITEHLNNFGKIDDNGDVIINLDVNLADIAFILNMTRETLSRIVSEMKKEGIIETRRKFIRIIDLNRFIS